MMVNVKYMGALRQITGKSEEVFQAENLTQLMKRIGAAYGKQVCKEIKSSHIVLNENRVQQRLGQNIVLKEGDCIAFFPVCCGG